MKYIELLRLLPAIIEVVVALEKAIEQANIGGAGPALKDMVLRAMGLVGDSTVISLVGQAIDIVVAAFNAIGLFKHRKPSP